MIVYAKKGIFSLNESEGNDFYTKLSGIKPTPTSKDKVLNDFIFKVVIIAPEDNTEGVGGLPGIEAWDRYRVCNLKNVFEYAGLTTSKALGLKPVLDHLGMEASQLAAFGDAPNDISMFEIAGYSVAMDTGWKEAKAAAHAISPVGPPESAFARAVAMLREQCL